MNPEIKVGDELAFIHYIGGTTFHKVDKITPTGRIVCGDAVLNPDLSIRGSDIWSNTLIKVATPDLKEKERIRREKARILDRLCKMDWPILTLEDLQKIDAILTAAKEKKS